MTKTNITKSIRNIMLVLSFILIAVFCFVGCGGLPKFPDNPAKTEIVTGNGSLAVTKGDYLYFVNGYKSYSDVGKTNVDGQVTYAALYRIKLENGLPVKVDPTYDSEGNEIFDGSRALKNIDVLAKKVAGFEYMGIYIFGDYLYYTSPHNGVDNNGTVLSEKIDFFRIRLDRSSSSDRLFTTESDGSSVSYNMMEIGGNVYLVILDGTNLQCLKINENNQISQRKISSEATSVAFSRYSNSSEMVSEFNEQIYYTRDLNESEEGQLIGGNVLCKYDLTEMKNYDKIYADGKATLTLKFASKTRIFYEKKFSEWSDSKIFSTNVVNEEGLNDGNSVCNTYNDYLLTGTNGNALIVNDGSKLILLNYSNNSPKTLFTGSATLIGTIGDVVYFMDGSDAIKSINFVEVANGTQPSVQDVASKAKTSSKNCATAYGTKVYYLSTDQTNNSVYLHMVDLTDDSGDNDYFIGVLEKADYDVEESDD